MKTLVPNYTLSGNTVTLGGVNTLADHLLFISDATTGQLLYGPAGPTLSGYTTISGNNAVATLSVAPAANTDLLTIYYDNGVNPVNAPTTITIGGSSATLPVSIASDNASPFNVTLNGGYGSNATLPAYDSIVGGTVTLGAGSSPIGSVSLASGQSLTGYSPAASITNVGGTASSLPGGATVLAGSSCTKMLTVQNTATLNNLYFYCGTSTVTASANGIQLAPGQGYQFSVLPSSSQYLYLSGNVSYALMYA